MKHLRVVLILIVLLLGIVGAAIFTANAGVALAGGKCAGHRLLDPPLVVVRVRAPDPGTWITVLEEGFDTVPGPLWQFRDDNGAVGGVDQWGRRYCQPFPLTCGSYSAWAVGGGADGTLLGLRQHLPRQRRHHDDLRAVQPGRRGQGGQMRFKLRYYQTLDGTFSWGASSDGAMFRGTCTLRPAVRVDDFGPRPG